MRGWEEFAEYGEFKIHGKPCDLAMGAMGRSATSGEFLAGFFRLTSG